MKNFFSAIGRWIKSHGKAIMIVLLMGMLLAGTAYGFYNLGKKQTAAANRKALTAASLFKNMPKPTKTPQSTAKTLQLPTTSAGFYRLNGTVQKNDKNVVTIKLTNGSTINLEAKEGFTYYNGKDKFPLNQLKKNTTVLATGTIGARGNFAVTAIQTQQ